MSRDVGLFLTVFLASAVEGVEAVTIVLAMGLTRGWRSAAAGTALALLALAALVAALGPALTALPIDALRLVVGALLLVFGLQWLRKAILRSAGYKALHDEEAIYAAELAAARAAGHPEPGIDRYGVLVSFKGVLLEGLEVAFIAVTFGTNQGNVALAAVAALVAVVIVTAAGAVARAPLSRVPENTMKFAVGVMLTSFGTFWGAEGAGAAWPAGDGALPALIVFTLAASLALVAVLRRRRAHVGAARASTPTIP
ncbi:MAG: COG4280 domain-containing protein [Thermoleophilaceae bacterium]